ncbi:MAG: Fe-Mn family superoxide dismutase [Dehalococcoidales bacterium]|nr:Fe-Mn family superoxide dismutase [Dehalococcoidales bacterium]
MSYIAQDYSYLLGIDGFSENLIRNHFTLYQGYVNNTNKLIEILSTMLKEDKTGTPEYAELKRRMGWEFNGMRLHEYYFENLSGKDKHDDYQRIIYAITENYGNYPEWEKDFKATGMMRGIGWVILYQDNTNGRLFNEWINEHDIGHFAGCNPVLVMDIFEHAFMVDYGLKKADYIEAFFKNIRWNMVEKRLK